MTARIETHTGEVVTEIVAPRVELLWDAVTGDGRVRFHMEKLTSLDGLLLSREPAGVLERDLADLMERDWITDDGPVSTVAVMLAIKSAFDTLFNEGA